MRIEAEEEEGFVEGIISIITTVSAQLPRLLFFLLLFSFFLLISSPLSLVSSLLFSSSGS
jgi:hypothetical protein